MDSSERKKNSYANIIVLRIQLRKIQKSRISFEPTKKIIRRFLHDDVTFVVLELY